MCSSSYHHSGFMAVVPIHHVPKCMICHKAIVAIAGRAHCSHDCIYLYINIYVIKNNLPSHLPPQCLFSAVGDMMYG